MTSNRNGDFREKWCSRFEGSYRSQRKVGRPRLFQIDLDQDGNPESCFVGDGRCLILSDDTLESHSERLLLPVPGLEGEAYVETADNHVRLYVEGVVKWSRELSKLRLGLGIGRDEDDEIRVDVEKYFGAYRQKLSVVALECMDVNGDNRPEILLFLSTGRVLVFALDGTCLWSRRLVKGCCTEASFILLPSDETESRAPRFMVSFYWRYRRRFIFWQKLEMEIHTFVLELGKVLSRSSEVGLVDGSLNTSGGMLTDRGNLATFEGANIVTTPRETSGDDLRTILHDPRSNARPLVLFHDEARQALRAETLERETVWEVALEVEIDSYEGVTGVLGAKNSPVQGWSALIYATSHKLAGYDVSVQETHLVVLDPYGKLVGRHVFATDEVRILGDVDLVLDDIDEDGFVEVLLILGDKAIALELKSTPNRSEQPTPGQDLYASLEDTPLPAEDLWSTDWLGLSGSTSLTRSKRRAS